jgi:hypothetical protein
MRVTVVAQFNIERERWFGRRIGGVAKCRVGVSGGCQTDGSPTRQVLQWRAYSCCAGCALDLLLGYGAENPVYQQVVTMARRYSRASGNKVRRTLREMKRGR